MPEVLISVANLYRYYGNLCAVRDVSFELPRGTVLGFLGPNGAGKSTTMQIISGTLAPSAGEIRVAGHDLLDEPVSAKAAIGYLPEQPPLYRDLTVFEFIQFCARLHRIPRAGIMPALTRVTEQCGLGEVQHRLIGNLSKGYRQRVGIAQAIIHRPEVVILDEPTVGLDPIQMGEIRDLIRALGEEHSVILSTHILPEVQAVCNHVQIIRRGELVLDDSIDGLARRMHGSSLYLGLRRPPAAEALLRVPGVSEVEELADGYRRVRYEAAESPAEALVEQAVAENWGLFELTPEKRSLEQVFLELAGDDASPPDLQEAA